MPDLAAAALLPDPTVSSSSPPATSVACSLATPPPPDPDAPPATGHLGRVIAPLMRLSLPMLSHFPPPSTLNPSPRPDPQYTNSAGCHHLQWLHFGGRRWPFISAGATPAPAPSPRLDPHRRRHVPGNGTGSTRAPGFGEERNSVVLSASLDILGSSGLLLLLLCVTCPSSGCERPTSAT